MTSGNTPTPVAVPIVPATPKRTVVLAPIAAQPAPAWRIPCKRCAELAHRNQVTPPRRPAYPQHARPWRRCGRRPVGPTDASLLPNRRRPFAQHGWRGAGFVFVPIGGASARRATGSVQCQPWAAGDGDIAAESLKGSKRPNLRLVLRLTLEKKNLQVLFYEKCLKKAKMLIK